MKMRQTLATASISTLMVLGGGGAAMAASVTPPEGGIWNYGVTAGVHLYSDYYNQNVCHGSSVRNDWGEYRSQNMAAGTWANASKPTTPVQTNEAFYRVC